MSDPDIKEPPILAREKFPEAIALCFSSPFRVLSVDTSYPLTSGAVWWFIIAHPGISAAGIIHQTLIPKGTVMHDIRRMVKEGWVEQRICDDDRRVRHLYATEASMDLANMVIDDLRQHMKRLRAEQGF